MRPLRPAWALALAVVLVVVLAPASARAGDAAAARELLKEGYALAQQGKCDEAIPHLLESLKLESKAITLINLADCEEKSGRLADALGHWVDARARAVAEGNGPIELEAEKRAKALEPRLPRLVVAVREGTPAGATVLRDGVALGDVSLGVPLPVNPGAHTVEVKAEGFADSVTEVSLDEGEEKRIEVAVGEPLPAEAGAAVPGAPDGRDAGPTTRTGGPGPLVWAGFGVAGAGLAVGTVTGLMALGKASAVKTACPGGECRDQAALDDVSAGRTLGTVSTVAFVVGGVGALVGIYGLVSGGGARTGAATTKPHVALDLGPTGGGLRGTF
jgi:hypothetical protein